MTTKYCEACKALDQHNIGFHLDTIYQPGGYPAIIRLCYIHSVELFKTGQTSFMHKYRPSMPEKEIPRKEADPLQDYFVFNAFR